MNESDQLPRVHSNGSVDLDWHASLKLIKRGPMYRLPMRGPGARAAEWLLSVNKTGAYFIPQGGVSSAGIGGLLLVVVLFLGVATFMGISTWDLAKRGLPFSALIIGGVGTLIFSAIAIAPIFPVFSMSYAIPVLANRKTRKIIQMQEARRVEADWDELVPYVEVVRSVSYSGMIQLHHLHLIKLSASGRVEKRIMVRSALSGPSESLAYYEFLRRYMEGEWDRLPEAYKLGGIRQSLLREFRGCLWNSVFNTVPWEKRSSTRKWVTSSLLIIFTMFWWPITMLTLLGSRLGKVPKFSPQDEEVLAGAETDSEDAEILNSKILPEPPIATSERGVYLFALAAGAVVWCMPGFGIIPMIWRSFMGMIG